MKRLMTFLTATSTLSCLGVAHSPAAVTTADLIYNWDGNTATAGEDWQSSAPASDVGDTWDTSALSLNTSTGSSTSIAQAWTFTSATSNVGTSVGEFATRAPDASFEVWFKPTDLIGGELIFETGGNGRGLAIALYDSQVVVLMKQGASNGDSEVVLTQSLAAVDIDDFVQVVVTTDGASSGTGSHQLYVNAVGATDAGVADATSSIAFGDFGGTDESLLGTSDQIGGSQNASGTGTVNDPLDRNATYSGFVGDIGLLRIYDDVLTSEEVAANFNAVIPEPGSFALLALGCACMWQRRKRN